MGTLRPTLPAASGANEISAARSYRLGAQLKRNLLAAGDFGLVRVDIETGQIDRLVERRTSPFP